ncbi:TPA: hypothetical protein DCX16_04895 [bacterium]|nr:hypothetical protein [bacterium]
MKKVLFFFIFFASLCLSQEDYILKGDLAFEESDFPSAISHYKDYLKLEPDGEFAPIAQYRISESLYQLGRFNDAIKEFEKLISIYPQSEYVKPSLSRLGDCYLKQGRKDSAIKVFTQIKKRFPETIESAYAESRLDELKEKPPSPKEIAKIKKARELFNKKAYPESYNEFISFIDEYPNSTYTLYAKFKIGECLYYQEKYDEAIPAYKDFISSYPDTPYTPYADYALSWAYYKVGNFELASATISSFLKKYKDTKYHPSANMLFDEIKKKFEEKEIEDLFNLGKKAYREKDLAKAKTYLETLENKYPKNKYTKEAKNLISEINEKLAEFAVPKIKALYENGEEKLKEKRYDEAISIFQKIIVNFPETEYTDLARLGISKAKKEKIEDEAKTKLEEIKSIPFDEAKVKYQEIISRYPTTDVAKEVEAELFKQEEKSQKEYVENLYKQALSLLQEGEISSAKELFQRIVILYYNSNYADFSRERLDEIRKKEDSERQARQFDIAWKYYELGEYKEAVRILNQITAIWPDSVYAERAENILSEISGKITEESASSIFKMAQSYYENKKYDKAFEVFRKIVELYPQTRFAKASLLAMERLNEQIANERSKEIYDAGKNYQFQKKYNEALEKFDKILYEYQTSYWAPHSQYAKAEIYFETRNFQNALIEYQGLAEMFPESPLVPHSLYHIADCYVLLGMKEDAVSTYRKLLINYPDSIYAKGQLRVMIAEKIRELEK